MTHPTLAQMLRAGIDAECAERFLAKQQPDTPILAVPSANLDAGWPWSKMNKLETRRARELQALTLVGDLAGWQYEAVSLRLAEHTFYKPDFVLWYPDGRVAIEETKGFWRDDAKVKIKVAARLFPMFTFTALRWVYGESRWAREVF